MIIINIVVDPGGWALGIGDSCRVGNLLLLMYCSFGLEVTLIFKGTEAS